LVLRAAQKLASETVLMKGGRVCRILYMYASFAIKYSLHSIHDSNKVHSRIDIRNKRQETRDKRQETKEYKW
jgi:hypothetical protein